AGAAGAPPPDAIILDVMMPEMDGYTFHSKLQETEGLQNIPIVVLSAKDKMKDMFASSNVFAFVEKPFEAKTLVDAVKAAIGSKKCRGYNTLNNPANSGRMLRPPLN
ncbi:MAG: response regulator, partial [Elusimicrobiota bacterium]